MNRKARTLRKLGLVGVTGNGSMLNKELGFGQILANVVLLLDSFYASNAQV